MAAISFALLAGPHDIQRAGKKVIKRPVQTFGTAADDIPQATMGKLLPGVLVRGHDAVCRCTPMFPQEAN